MVGSVTILETKSNSSGRTPLLYAVEYEHKAVVKLLLEKGAKLETKYEGYGLTPLLWAVGNGHEAVVKLLLERGAELETNLVMVVRRRCHMLQLMGTRQW
jgi:ankyrin repeat protein